LAVWQWTSIFTDTKRHRRLVSGVAELGGWRISGSNDTAGNCQEGALLTDIAKAHIRWRLWHGQL
jgi:hypothetical protein